MTDNQFDSGYMFPRVSPGELQAMIERELPGFKFRLHHDEYQFAVRMEVVRQVEGKTMLVSDQQVMSEPQSLNAITVEAVRQLRTEAIDAYGLNAEIDRRIYVAVKEALNIQREALMRDLLEEIEDLRYVPLLDDDGYQRYGDDNEPIYVDTLPKNLLALLDWAAEKRKAR